MPILNLLPTSLTRNATPGLLLVIACAAAGTLPAIGTAAERPTLNHTRDPRPDILPHPFYYAHTEYRRAYNRPRYWSGWIADKISVTSQEAMVWKENVAAGRYDGHDCPPMYKSYYYPKPWEVLLTGPRPDFPKPKKEDAPRSNQAADSSEPTATPDFESAEEALLGK